jgi:hypothetical protein
MYRWVLVAAFVKPRDPIGSIKTAAVDTAMDIEKGSKFLPLPTSPKNLSFLCFFSLANS